MQNTDNQAAKRVPTSNRLKRPILRALSMLGGSGNIREIYNEVVKLENFDEEILAVPSSGNHPTKIRARMAWARTDLKLAGYLENSSRGVWALTEKGKKVIDTDLQSLNNEDAGLEDPPATGNDLSEENQEWQEELNRILTEKMTPDAFERLTQRLLRESGFISVEVTGRTGDGGIDGKGIARINGLMSFHIAFQCKKYQGSVSASDMRDFRGAITGRADRGMFITTGSFTKSAIEEANRDGVAPIDLVDGEQLADKLKELALGVKTEMVEKVTVDPEWFLNL